MRRLTAALLLLVAGAAIAQLHVAMQRYTPVIRVASPEGITYTTQLEATPERGACAAASRLFLASLDATCEHCEVLFARCERAPVEEAFEASLARHVIVVPGVRIDIAGPSASTRQSCEQIARDFAARGLPSASCTRPPKDGQLL